jgi:hypothetical protein
MKSHYREEVNAPTGAENEVFRTFAEARANRVITNTEKPQVLR